VSVVKGCCPGEDVRSPLVRVYISWVTLVAHLIATIDVKHLRRRIDRLTSRHVTDPTDAVPPHYEHTEQGRSRGRSDRAYLRV